MVYKQQNRSSKETKKTKPITDPNRFVEPAESVVPAVPDLDPVLQVQVVHCLRIHGFGFTGILGVCGVVQTIIQSQARAREQR